ncbi:MAG: alpha/beta fold hydrolase [Thermoflexales bacterium]
MSTFALIHSPICGTETWLSTATALEARGHRAFVPLLLDDEAYSLPLWRQNADAIALAFRRSAMTEPIIWVAHSGAGFRLPAYRAACAQPAGGYIFVDAGLPAAGLSQLDTMRSESAALGRELLAHLESGGVAPNWTDEALREVLPDAAHRALVLNGLRPRGLRYYNEPIYVPESWPDAPCAYLLFQGESYGTYAELAAGKGWRVRRIDAGHFHMLVDPGAVAEALIALAETM